MKKSLLILSLLVFSFSNGQSPIAALNGVLPITNPPISSTDGLDNRPDHIRLAPGSSFAESNAGPGQVWNLMGLTVLPNLFSYYNTVPTAAELSAYPGTTLVCTGYNSADNFIDSKSYFSGTYTMSGLIGSGGVTAYADNEVLLNYTTNNVDLGTFPKVYGTTTSDAVAGTYIYGDYTGAFTGTYTTSVDASGTMEGSAFEPPFPVTRFKTVENLQISYPGFGVVGTFIQTTYRYYRANELWPYVKSTNRVITIVALSIDSNVSQIEKSPETFLLSVPESEFSKMIALYPNPATNTINVTLNDSQKLISLTVTDQLGKTILTKKENTTLDVSGLQKGVYFMTIVTDAGSSVKKFVKN
ncbi:T9SS type A sorting domain-containing protein [Flavobacterium sp. SM2513]|uniref:T9SS type A sorting domain-containing protein n=1 Tax=Flavobacterium sp. SM2513 TaxID=3424766 RepID=UPI003D7FEA36